MTPKRFLDYYRYKYILSKCSRVEAMAAVPSPLHATRAAGITRLRAVSVLRASEPSSLAFWVAAEESAEFQDGEPNRRNKRNKAGRTSVPSRTLALD